MLSEGSLQTADGATPLEFVLLCGCRKQAPDALREGERRAARYALEEHCPARGPRPAWHVVRGPAAVRPSPL